LAQEDFYSPRIIHNEEIMIHVTIDNQSIQVAEGRTILEACRENDIRIPTLCYHPALEPYGGCRLCMVELIQSSRSRLVASCTFPCEDGLIIQTHSQKVLTSRRMTMELILASSHNNPQMLSLAEELGVNEIRFKLPEESDCVLCGLCVRACKEIVGVSAISVIQRGIAKKVAAPFQVTSSRCIGCGTCTLICPTGTFNLNQITGYREVTPTVAAYRRGYYRIGGELDLRPNFIENIAELFSAGQEGD
jgi:bidirectional [NiFe] hydrogenase diaphorase subunit